MNINPSNSSETSKMKNPMQRLVINTILIILIAMAALVVFGLGTGLNRNVLVILGVILASSLLFAIRGNTFPGQIAAPIGVMVAILYTAYNGDGLHDEIMIATPLVIVLAGLLLGNQWAVVFSIILAAGVAGIGLVEINGTELSPASALTEYDDIITTSIMLIATALLLRLIIVRLNNSIIDARRNEDAQVRANRELRILQADLEKRVTERTLQLNRRALQLQASSEVGRAVSSISDLNELLENVTILISERFGYYHVGVFLIDQTGEIAVLRASNSPGGHKMIEEGHSLQVGSKSIVGYVTQHRDPRIAMDVGREATFFNNPHLPETRSEMALPLIAAGRLLGALDIQSHEAAAFSQDDVNVLQILADQVAIAIENSNLFAESRAALEASRRAYGDLSRQDWIKRLQGRKDIGYHFDSQGNIVPVEGGITGDLASAQNANQPVRLDPMTLAVPFNISDLPLGVVKLKKQPGSREWTEREVNLIGAIVGNLGEALESARLYENTQKRAERERLTADISSHIRENLDVDAVLRTAVVQIRQALNLANVEVRLESGGAEGQPIKRQPIEKVDGKISPPDKRSRPVGNGNEGGNGKSAEPRGRPA